jgi:CBS domain-containing protein
VLRVRDLATPDPLILDEQLPLRTAALLLLHYQVGGAPVVDHGRLVGVLTESDLLAREAALRIRGGWAAREEHRRRQALTVGEACSRPAVTVSPHTTVREAARLLLDQDVSRLIVVSDHQAVGVLTRRDVLRTLIRSQHELQRLVDSRVAATAVEGVRAEVTEGGHVVVTGHARLRSELEALLRALAPIDGVVEARVQADWDVDDLERRWTETVHP